MHTDVKNVAVIFDSAFKLDKQINFSSLEILQKYCDLEKHIFIFYVLAIGQTTIPPPTGTKNMTRTIAYRSLVLCHYHVFKTPSKTYLAPSTAYLSLWRQMRTWDSWVLLIKEW